MFDTIFGLPVHALVVHAVVVLLPLMAIVTVAVAFRPSWRAVATPWVLVADLLVYGLTFAAAESGEALKARLGENGAAIEEHMDYGTYLPWFALALAAAAALLWFSVRYRAALLPVALVAVVVTGLAAIVWTVLTGDSGARAVWEDVVSNTRPPG
jgi:uncharacterized membrane protein